MTSRSQRFFDLTDYTRIAFITRLLFACLLPLGALHAQDSPLLPLWERGAFHELLHAQAPGDGATELDHYALEVAQILYPTSGEVTPELLPNPPAGAASIWHQAAPYIAGIAYQRAYRFQEASEQFASALQALPPSSPLHQQAKKCLAQCAHALQNDAVWTPLKPLRIQPASGQHPAQAMPQKWVEGRWVPVPEELRSRHDRRNGFVGHMFIHPMHRTAWFASDRHGRGETDVYRVEVFDDGDFGSVEPAPEGVNSPFNERTPVWSAAEQTLYFSSDRATSTGSFDIYAAYLASASPEVRPLPFAVNSAFNESHFTPGADGWSAWLVSDRLGADGALYRIASESETRHPVHLHAAVESPPRDPGMTLSLWDTGSGRLLWTGPIAEVTPDNRLAIAADGARLLALLHSTRENAHTWFEWSVPVVAEAVHLDFILRADSLPGAEEVNRTVLQEAAATPWPLHWSLPTHAWSQGAIPTAPVTASNLPAQWRHLASTDCWRQGSAEERWLAVRAFEEMEALPPFSAAPEGEAWELVTSGARWTPEVLSAWYERNAAFQDGLEACCVDAAWAEPCAQWRRKMEEGIHHVERGVFWSKLSQTLLPFHALHAAQLPIHEDDFDWFAQGVPLMEQAIQVAYADRSWESLVDTREVFRDWLLVHWEGMKANANTSTSLLERAHWELEQSFALPVWNNLEPAAWALVNGYPEVDVKDITAPAPPSIASAMRAVLRNEQPAPRPVAEESEVLGGDSTFVIQLGAFAGEPDPTAFIPVESGLKRFDLNGFTKVVCGSFNDKDSARDFLLRVWEGGGYPGAFVLAVEREVWEAAPTWEVAREAAGFAAVGTLDGDSMRSAQAFGEGAVFWPQTEGTWSVWSPLYARKRFAERALASWDDELREGTVRAYGLTDAPTPVFASAPVPAPEPETATAADSSRWAIRVADCPEGATHLQRTAVLRLPDELKVRSTLYGTGVAYLSGEIEGESKALELLRLVKASGFPQARLVPVHVD